MNIANAVDRFTRQLAANGRSTHTRAAYRRDLEALARWIGGKPDLVKITPDLLARFLTSDAALLTPTGDPRSPISVNRTKSALRSFFRFCHDSGWIKDNPARLIRSARTSRLEPCTISEEELRRLRGACDRGTRGASRDRLILEMLIGTGMRLGSLVAINVSDIDLKSGVVHIRTKGNGRDKVFLNPQLQRLIARYLKIPAPEANGGPNVALFRSVHGKRLGARQIQLNFAKWCREAGIERRVSVHSLRHTFATRLYRKTGDLYLVQRALGHRHIMTTEVYAKVSDQRLRRAIARQ